MKKRIRGLWILLAVLAAAGCSQNETSDAYGQFEAVETTISAETSGTLVSFTATEGERLEAGQQVGLIDTTQLHLQRKELLARLEAVQSNIANINAQMDVQKEQLQLAVNDLKRIRALMEDNAATQQQLDNAQGQVQIMREKMDALQAQKQSIFAEMEAVRAKVDQLEEQIQDAKIINPVQGTVLTTFIEPHEWVGRGQPLYQIAALDTLILRVYVSGGQLPSVKLGQTVEVIVDKNAEENRSLQGTVSWIANEAEFTPKMIQTKEERVTQVYAVKVRVPNPKDILKIGMPGEVNF
ncbi:MAG TPA: HlyD family efflux transporter periplasmic adaptor subunit [Balneolaceae bacterium]|nr:HlyD family efflux transporter periplasmic adaptor subunit [Balneolaceae bacterium]